MLSASEQFFLEQLNRARLNPKGEAERFDIGLNDPDPTDESGQTLEQTLTKDVRQPLAENTNLSTASGIHSQAYLDGHVLTTGPNAGHEWNDGTTPADRAEAAGFGSRFVGENLAFGATTAAFSSEQAILQGPSGIGHHQGLFYSVTHRPNLLNADYTQTGVAQVLTDGYQSGGVSFNASVITNKFGTEDVTDRFLTGVAYDDHDGDSFYSIGEGRGGVTITALGHSTTTAGAGGYALNLGVQTAPVEVLIDWQGQTLRAAIDLSASNVKLDILGGSRILASSNLTLLDDLAEGGLLGAGNLSLTGNAMDNLLLVGRGDNVIDGAGGVNTAKFTGAFNDYQITVHAGTITVTDQRDSALADGTNTLQNIAFLQFADGIYTPGLGLEAQVTQGRLILDDPIIGAFMSAQERGQDLILTGSTQDLPNGTPILVTLNEKSYVTRTESGQWSVTIRSGRQTQDGYVPGDLDALENATEYQIMATAQTAAGPVQASFNVTTTFDTPTLGTYPSPFAGTLDAADLQDGVTLKGVSSAEGGSVTITLAGVAHTASIENGVWEIHFPGSTLKLLENGTVYDLPLQLRDQFENAYTYGLPSFTADLNFPDPDPLPGTYQLDLILQGIDGAALGAGTQARVAIGGDGPNLGVTNIDAMGAVQFDVPEGAQGMLYVTRDYQQGIDPNITALDALNVLRMAVGLDPSFGPASAQNFIAADINADGRVTALDALEVLRAAVGLPAEHAPRWVYFTAETDFSELELDRNATYVESGIDITTLSGDQPLAMSGILLGNIEHVT
jgi:hypothetical protein